jgi:hypothetical protein
MAIATKIELAYKSSSHISNLLTIKWAYQKKIHKKNKFKPQAVHAAVSGPPSAVVELPWSQYHCQWCNG